MPTDVPERLKIECRVCGEHGVSPTHIIDEHENLVPMEDADDMDIQSSEGFFEDGATVRCSFCSSLFSARLMVKGDKEVIELQTLVAHGGEWDEDYDPAIVE